MCEGCEQKLLISPALYRQLVEWATQQELMQGAADYLARYVEPYPQISPAPLSDTDDLAQRCHAAYLEASRP